MEDSVMSAGRGAILLTVLGALGDLLDFCYRVVLSRLAGAQVMGLYQLVMSVYSVFMSIVVVGFSSAVSNLTARHLAMGNRRAVHQLLQTGLCCFLILLVPTGAAMIGASDFISTALLGDARTQLGIILLVPCVALTGIENMHKNVFYGAGLVGTPAVVGLLEQLVRSTAVIWLLVRFLPQWPERVVGLIVVGMVVCEVFSSCTYSTLYRCRFLRRGLSGPGEEASARRRAIFSVALPLGLNALLGNLLAAANSALIPRQLVAGGMGRDEAMGAFGVLCGMTMPMLALPTVFLGALNLVLAPRLTRAAALHQHSQVQRLIDRALSVTSVLALPTLSMMLVVGPDLGQLMFHQPQVGAYLGPLTAVMAMSCFCSVLACVLNSVGRQKIVAAISLAGGAVQLVFTAVLTPLPGVGLGGYVVGMVVSTALELGLCLWFTCRCTGLKTKWFEWLTAPSLSAALAALCSNLLFRLLKDMGVSPLQSGVAAIVFAALLDLAAIQAQGVDLRSLLHLQMGSKK